jgi:hypothetical protein
MLGTRLFVAVFTLIFVGLAIVSYVGFELTCHWFATVPTDGPWTAPNEKNSEALTGALTLLGSVSVVVWTGGLVAFQMKGFDVATSLAMDLLGICFVGCCAGLVTNALPFEGHSALLRIVASFFAFRYGIIYIGGILFALENRKPALLTFNINGMIYMLPIYVVIAVFPTLPAVAVMGFTTLYLGLWKVLRTLYAASTPSI